MEVFVVGCGLPNLMVGHRHIKFLLGSGDHLLEVDDLGSVMSMGWAWSTRDDSASGIEPGNPLA
jgi:hypothetical protein